MAFTRNISPYRSWQQKLLQQIQQEGLLAETARGPVEYQVTGQGPAVIYAHGTPGGYDQGLAFTHFIKGLRCTFIALSRPGYLRTPLASGATPAEQADLYAALLDVLGIEQASLIGFSGGGPSALQFAIRHPERCRGVVMIGGIVQRNSPREHIQALPPLQRVGAEIVERMLVSDPFLFVAYPIARLVPSGDAVSAMLLSGAHFELRKIGYENDLAQFEAIGQYELEKITAPVLVVHGTSEAEVPFEDALVLARQAPNVTLLALGDGDHSAFYTHGKTVWPMVREFLEG